MKRFLLFKDNHYYPLGGWRDFYVAVDEIEDARYIARHTDDGWWHIVDTETMEIVEKG